jgi:DNA-binding GntR family transcriptional regulator
MNVNSQEVPRDAESTAAETWEWAQDAGPRETAYEFVYRVIRHALLDGKLGSGTRLFQTEIADRLGVSTTPVREALQKLASEGLVDLTAGRGATVRKLSLKEWNEIVAIKGQLEPFVLRLAAERITPEAIAELERILDQMGPVRDITTWVDMNRQFHRVYYEAADSPLLKAMLVGLVDAEAIYVAKGIRERPELSPQGLQDHAAIIEGLKRRDVACLEKLIARHVSTTLAPYTQGWLQ